ncbi:haloacid dehalogenase [Deltaproteobacteria bacterium]|nr:haloacid dehalogenase [Deltaproteobacteria bacterium]
MSPQTKRDNISLASIRDRAAKTPYGIIFDCDGVLFDSKAANTAFYNHIRAAVHLPPMTDEEATRSHMLATQDAITCMVPPDLLQDALDVCKKTNYRDLFMDMMLPADHVYSFLQTMKARGIPLALCTNRTDSVHLVLRHFAMDSYFTPVMTITHVRPKPDAQGLTAITKIWDTSPDSVIFLGDSLVDQQSAINAGVPFWSFNNPDLTASVHVSGFKELEDIVHLMLSS